MKTQEEIQRAQRRRFATFGHSEEPPMDDAGKEQVWFDMLDCEYHAALCAESHFA